MNYRAKGGFILVIVLALLGVLAFLALELTQRSQTSRQLSARQVHQVKARLSARSGLEKFVVGAQRSAWHFRPVPFEQKLDPAGDDRNRNGQLEGADEDPALDGSLDMFRNLEDEPTPSMALAEDPGVDEPRALSLVVDGSPHGATWLDDRAAPTLLAAVQAWRPCLDLNAGIEAGMGTEGARYEEDFNNPATPVSDGAYSASSLTHPFNIPLVRLLNAWGNYHKYRKMVRTGKTYDWTLGIDHNRNIAEANPSDTTKDRFDCFYPSGLAAGDTPLGNLLVGSRPAGGYRNLDEPLKLLEGHIKSWRDINGNPGYPSGSWQRLGPDPIGPVTEADIRRILDEFRALSALHPLRVPFHQFKRALPMGKPKGNILNAFALDDTRQILNVRRYKVPQLPIDINRAPASVLAALIHSAGALKYWTYKGSIRDIDTDEILTYEPHFNTARLAENCYAGSQYPGKQFILGTPLFSMTESVSTAATLVTLRQRSPLLDHGQLREHLVSLRNGFDHKTTQYASSFPADATANLKFDGAMGYDNARHFHDLFQGYVRQSILSGLLNPHLNCSWLVWDEALPRAFANRINGIGVMNSNSIGKPYGNREFDKRYFFDKFDDHEVGGFFTFNSGSFEINCLGRCLDASLRTLAVARIHTHVRIFSVLDIHTQRDLNTACTTPPAGPSTLGTDWISYPEAPQVPPADWDGMLALKPRLDPANPVPWGSDLRARVRLEPYTTGIHPSENQAGTGDIWPKGPRTSGVDTGTLRTSLNPAPGMAVTSLLPVTFDTLEVDTPRITVDSASDLMPGGGMRVSPFHNSFWMPDPADPATVPAAALGNVRRKEAVLALRNNLVSEAEDATFPNPATAISGSKVLQSFHDGAVSFWFKPLITPPIPDNTVTLSTSGKTLFHTHFAISDEETATRCASLPGTIPAEADLRKWYVATLRLVWGSLHGSNSSSPSTSVAFRKAPTNISTGLSRWPYIPTDPDWPGFMQGSYVALVTPLTNLTNNFFFFQTMKGLQVGAYYGCIPGGNLRIDGLNGSPGNLFLATGSPHDTTSGAANLGQASLGHWWSLRPFPNECLFLEFQVSKYAYINPNDFPLWFQMNTNPPGGLEGWGDWDNSDRLSTLAESGAYLNGPATPLHLMDSTDPDHVDYHSVRKVFIIGHPINPSTSAPAAPYQGRGPRDRNGDHQALVAPGRWNHFLVAWRDLYALLKVEDSTPGHRGGALAVYVNGALKKTGAWNFQIAGLILTTDYCEAYASGSPLDTPGLLRLSSWETSPHTLGNYHTTYQSIAYAPRFNWRCKTVHWPETAYPLNTSVANVDRAVPFPEMGDLHRTPQTAMSASHLSYSRGVHDFLTPDLHNNLPSRFYFGCQAHSMLNRSRVPATPFYFPTGIAWGSFMDIQIFDAPTQSADASVNIFANDGGFIAELPGFDAQSPLATNTTAFPLKVYPLNLLPHKNVLVAGVSWTAHLPEFHRFWDDRGGTDPDATDTQQLDLTTEVLGADVATLSKSQDPDFTETSSAWTPPSPVLVDDAGDLVLKVTFKGPPFVSSTPLIESFHITVMDRIPVFKDYRIE